MMESKKPTLFISYCHRDGSMYADDLEEELQDYFEVRRDKTRLIPNDDLYDFMAEIANQDYVIVVLTTEYTKSRNCMLEMAYLANQDDWAEKTMVLVVDNSLYEADNKINILTYWRDRQRKATLTLETCEVGSSILEQEIEYLKEINNKLEPFLVGLTRRLNPSQLAIVNEMVRLRNRRHMDKTNDIISEGESFVLKYLEINGSKTLTEISEGLNFSKPKTSRILRNLVDTGRVTKDVSPQNRQYKVK